MKDLLEKLMEAEVAKPSPDEEKLQYFLDRIHTHINLVQDAAKKIVEAYPEYKELLTQVKDHDASKLEEPDMTPYIDITWRHKLEKENGEFDPMNNKGYQKPGNLDKEAENAATLHHVTTNSHHPENHLKDKAEVNINKDDRSKSDKCVDASAMPDLDIAHMVSDWQAMSTELKKNTAREWYEKQKDTRWHFSDEQDKLIDKLLAVFETETANESNDIKKERGILARRLMR